MHQKTRNKFHCSVKMCITLWFTAFITFIVILSLIFIFYFSSNMAHATIKENLIQTVENKKTNEKQHYDNDTFNDTDSSTITAILNDGNLIEGTLPDGLKEIPYIPGKVRYIKTNDSRYYIYDQKYVSKKNGSVWIRGYTCLDSIQIASSSTIKLILIFFPMLILIAAKGGYYITSKALDPVVKMTRTANAVSDSNDLSMRIDLTNINNPKNEFYILGQTFNQMFERLEQASIKERQFTSDASHELRTPTAIILAQADYLVTISSSKKQKKTIDSILRQAKRMSSLISDLLLFARADQNRQQLCLEDFDFSELTELVIEELSVAALKKNISLIPEIEKGIITYGDQTLLIRMLINLISNAIQYGHPQGYVNIQLASCPTGLTCSITDNGIGINKEQIGKIWDRFYQADPSRKNENGSSGLGLSMVKWIIEAHHGTIQAESRPGTGSTFTFWLPDKKHILSFP